jgi:hypothetical protein
MAHNHGSEYQVRIVRGDGTEELSGWLNSAEQVAQAIAADRNRKARLTGLGHETFSAPTAQTGSRESWNVPLRISRLHDTAHTTPVIWWM